VGAVCGGGEGQRDLGVGEAGGRRGGGKDETIGIAVAVAVGICICICICTGIGIGVAAFMGQA
jgi:hypothetical protein